MSLRVIWLAYGTLVGLLVLTVALSFVDFGGLNVPLALGIGGIKAVLIVLVFMEVWDSTATIKLCILTAIIWSAIFGALSFSDYVTRQWVVNPTSEGIETRRGGIQ